LKLEKLLKTLHEQFSPTNKKIVVKSSYNETPLLRPFIVLIKLFYFY